MTHYHPRSEVIAGCQGSQLVVDFRAHSALVISVGAGCLHNFSTSSPLLSNELCEQTFLPPRSKQSTHLQTIIKFICSALSRTEPPHALARCPLLDSFISISSFAVTSFGPIHSVLHYSLICASLCHIFVQGFLVVFGKLACTMLFQSSI